MTAQEVFSESVLTIDPEAEIEIICSRLRELIKKRLKRRGIVIGISGGIDSSVTAALAVEALGADRVMGLMMPERHSSNETVRLSNMMLDHVGIEKTCEDISNILEAFGFYRRYEDAVRLVLPEYGEQWKSKIVTPNIVENRSFSLFSIVAQSPEGRIIKRRLPLNAYLGVVAATNFKQRTRKVLEYYHADRRNFAVAGTPNRLEYDLGFFVKNGDGAADIKPIAHLYKSQVYQLAEYLEVPEEIRRRPPSTDTYSLEQGQDEFYFSLSYRKMDLCLYGKNNGFSEEIVGGRVGLSREQVRRVFEDVDNKRAATAYLHLPPLLISDVPEVRRFQR